MSEEERRAVEEPSFSAAMQELERILKGIEDEEIDIDALGTELERAARLLELCRGKIRRAELEVSQIVQGLDDSSAPAEADDEDDGDEDDGDDVADEGSDDELPF